MRCGETARVFQPTTEPILMSHHDDDDNFNDSPNEHFQQVLERGTRAHLHG